MSAAYPILVLIGPTGVNKRELFKRLVQEFGAVLAPLVCHTDKPNDEKALLDRLPGSGEEFRNCNWSPDCMNQADAEDYNVIDTDMFNKMRSEGKFVQTANVMGYQYGLSWSAIEEVAKKGLAGILTGEIELMLGFRMSGLQTRCILCLEDNQVTHEERLRQKLMRREFRGRCLEQHIAWCLDRATSLYPELHRQQPGWFEAVVWTDNLEVAFCHLSELVLHYLGESDKPYLDELCTDTMIRYIN